MRVPWELYGMRETGGIGCRAGYCPRRAERSQILYRRDAGREKELGFPKYRAGLHRSGSAPGAMRVWSPKLGWHRYGDMGFSICVAATRMPVS